MRRSKILAIVGTRPEVIKMAPLIRDLRARSRVFDVRVCVVAQQNGILREALTEWDLRPDIEISPSASRRDPAALLGAVLPQLHDCIAALDPRFVLVHGDTTTTVAGALAAFYRATPVGHVEAGLRTGLPSSPFPEEMHRRIVDGVAEVLYAPTPTARENLIAEGCEPGRIEVVGNTVVDALQLMIPHAMCPHAGLVNGERLVVVTAHRHESFGAGLDNLCAAVRRLALERADLRFVYVLHPHPQAHEPALRILGDVPRVTLIPPQSYRAFVGLMQRADLIVTDSGGIQEEAPWLGTPVLVAREHTERPEAVEAGVAMVVGHDPDAVAHAVERVLDDPRVASGMARLARPFGEPGAAARIGDDLERRCAAP